MSNKSDVKKFKTFSLSVCGIMLPRNVKRFIARDILIPGTWREIKYFQSFTRAVWMQSKNGRKKSTFKVFLSPCNLRIIIQN